ncbi:hypothetical protein [Paracoccus sp. DMF]|nr:hypothetical protein [Paracoccus sp. DMF]MCV2445699.1 hypothetical protein [Paracoccus sp. DMF]
MASAITGTAFAKGAEIDAFLAEALRDDSARPREAGPWTVPTRSSRKR